jgi:hypothetical protein
VRFFSVFIVMISLLPGLAKAAEFNHSALARQALEQHIRPGYTQLLGAAQGFEADIGTYCSTPPGNNISAVKKAFEIAVMAWARIEHLRFGPIQNKARHARMLYWPDRKGLGRKQVARALRKSDASVTMRESLQGKSVALQGFGALEYILYAKGSEKLSIPGPARAHRCAFMTAIAKNIVQMSNEVLGQWSDTGAYAAIFLQPGPDNPAYLEPKEVTLEIAKAYLVGLERVRDIRIAGPLGLQRKNARRKLAAFERSGLSTSAIASNLEGILHLYEKGGLMERISIHEAGMGKAIQNDLKISLKQLQSISLPMKSAVEDPASEDKLMAIGFPLKTVREEAARVLAQAAGLPLGFNALDGD